MRIQSGFSFSWFAGLLFLASGLPLKAQRSRHVTIAAIGTAPRASASTASPAMVAEVIAFWERQLKQVWPSSPDLVLLPEAADRPSGLSIAEQFHYFRLRGDEVLDFFRRQAAAHHCYIALGTKRQSEDSSWHNSVIIIDREGKTKGIYNKNFPTLDEIQAGIRPADEAPVFDLDFGRVACAICFDLNFHELLDRYSCQHPDLILFSSVYHGGPEQDSWAYGCRSYFVSAVADPGIASEIKNPLGEVVASSTNYFHYTVATINLDFRLAHLDYNWERLAALQSKYGGRVTVHDPGKLGSVLIYSNDPALATDDLVREFHIELLDDYFSRARRLRLASIHQNAQQ
ncbi:MAG TPA: carbon-nitrogen hydrolase family protein [Chitinophagaceae bacterium]|nr:carbon-nitrogen hydrolase family protein [Chitinophagaceae bacterium]